MAASSSKTRPRASTASGPWEAQTRALTSSWSDSRRRNLLSVIRCSGWQSYENHQNTVINRQSFTCYGTISIRLYCIKDKGLGCRNLLSFIRCSGWQSYENTQYSVIRSKEASLNMNAWEIIIRPILFNQRSKYRSFLQKNKRAHDITTASVNSVICVVEGILEKSLIIQSTGLQNYLTKI